MSETVEQKPKSLVSKLTEVMKQVKYIEKKGFNSFSKYKYATEADVAEKVREVLAEQNIMMIPNMTSHSVREHTSRKGNIEYIVTVNMEFSFIDGDSGEKIVFNMVGEGQDSGDKGTYKAITGAQKYALMKAFMIPTGDDPENDSAEDNSGYTSQTPPVQQRQQEQPKAISGKQIGLIKVKAGELAKLHKLTVAEVYQKVNMTEAGLEKLTSKQGSDLIGILDRSIDKANSEAGVGA